MDIPVVAPIKPTPNAPSAPFPAPAPQPPRRRHTYRLLGFFAGIAIAAGGLFILYPFMSGSVLGLPKDTVVLVSFGDTMQTPLYEVDASEGMLVPHEVAGVPDGSVVMDAVETAGGIYYLIGMRATSISNIYRLDAESGLVAVTSSNTFKAGMSYEPGTARLAYTEWTAPNPGVLGESYAGLRTVVVVATAAGEPTAIGEGYGALMLPGGTVLVQGTSTLDAVDITSLERRTVLTRDSSQPMPILDPVSGELLVHNDVSGMLDYFDVSHGGFSMNYLRSEERADHPDALTFAADGAVVEARRSTDFTTIMLAKGAYTHTLKNPNILSAPETIRFITAH